MGAIKEHITRSGQAISSPTVAHVDGGEIRAATEHVTHVGDIGGIETAQVQVIESRAALEHTRHVGGIRGIEIFKMCDRVEVRHTTEPTESTYCYRDKSPH